MLPYYLYKIYKEKQALKEAALDKSQEQFLTEAVERAPPTSELSTPTTTIDALFEESKSSWNKDKERKSEPWAQTLKRWGTFSRASSSSSIPRKESALPSPSLKPATPGGLPEATPQPSNTATEQSATEQSATEQSVTEPELTNEQRDLAEVLDSLDMQAGNQGVAFTTPSTRALLNQFTQIIKDVINGVPTAYNDLIEFLESSSTQLSKEWNALPKSFQKLIRSLPFGVPPDVFAAMTAAAAAPTASDPSNTAAGPSVPKATTGFASKLDPRSLFTKTNPQTGTKSRTLPTPSQVKELLGTGGGIVTVLRSILTFLKTRFPMLAGTNALMSMGISILMLVLWYCHKRGKEMRLRRETEGTNSGETESEEPIKDKSTDGPNPDFQASGTR